MFNQIMSVMWEWLFGLSPEVMGIVAIGCIVVVFFGKPIAFFLLRKPISQKYALWAVRLVENYVILTGEEKSRLAILALNRKIRERFGVALPDVFLKDLIKWAYSKMIGNGEEIKAKDVLDIPKEALRLEDGVRLIPMEGGGFKIEYNKSF